MDFSENLTNKSILKEFPSRLDNTIFSILNNFDLIVNICLIVSSFLIFSNISWTNLNLKFFNKSLNHLNLTYKE